MSNAAENSASRRSITFASIITHLCVGRPIYGNEYIPLYFLFDPYYSFVARKFALHQTSKRQV